MAKQSWVYRKDKSGNIKRLPAGQIIKHNPKESLEDFDTRMRQTLYQLECEKGSRFRVPEFSKTQLKKIWWDDKAA